MAYASYSVYKRYINSQKKEYEQAIIDIYEIIEKLKEGIKIDSTELKVDDKVRVEGRIKAFKSAIKNDLKDMKALDDCFGIRIIADNSGDAIMIQQIMKRLSNPKLREALGDSISEDTIFRVVEEKNHAQRLATKYNATHHISVRNPKNINSPLIEIQYWDKETEERCTYGDLNHTGYKHIQGKIQEAKSGKIGIEIPEYYEFDEEGYLYKLDKVEAIRKMFPELIEIER